MAAHLEENLVLSLSLSDMSFFFPFTSGELKFMVSPDIIDTPLCVNDAFLRLSRQMLETFDSEEPDVNNSRV